MPDNQPPDCHEFITIYCDSCGHSHQVRAECGFRFCPFCSKVRAARIRRRLNFIISNYPPPRGQNLKMITLSTVNCQDLAIGIRHLVASFRKLRQQRFWKRYCSGGATIIEITGKKGNFHPHLHILCYCSYIPWKQLRTRWYRLSAGSGCYISVVSKAAALSYLTKYVTKCECPEDSLVDISDEIKKFRLFQRFGSWHHFKVPKTKAEFPCPSCGDIGWISEYAIRKLSRSP